MLIISLVTSPRSSIYGIVWEGLEFIILSLVHYFISINVIHHGATHDDFSQKNKINKIKFLNVRIL